MTYVLLWRVYDNRIKYIIIIIIVIIIDQVSDLNIVRRILSGNNCISFYNPILGKSSFSETRICESFNHFGSKLYGWLLFTLNAFENFQQ